MDRECLDKAKTAVEPLLLMSAQASHSGHPIGGMVIIREASLRCGGGRDWAQKESWRDVTSGGGRSRKEVRKQVLQRFKEAIHALGHPVPGEVG